MRVSKIAGLLGTILILAAVAPLAANQMRVPFVLQGGYTIVVRGSIGTLKGLNFIIDTGTVPSIVDTRLSRRLGLDGSPDQVAVLFARTLPAQRVVLPQVNVGPVHATGVEALTQDLSFVKKGLGVRIDALIGLDVLGKSNFAIDYAAHCLRFDTVADSSETWANMIGDDFPAVLEIQLNGTPLRLLMDTGAKHTVLFASRVQGLFAGEHTESAKVGAMGGEVKVNRIEAPRAALGETPVAMKSVFLLPTPADLALQIDGFLAVVALNPLRVDFDFGRRAVGWKW